jgi:two-component system response regulator RegX3
VLRLSNQVSIDTQTLKGTSHQKEIKYTRREVEVLIYLQCQKRPVTRDELLTEVWGYKTTGNIDTRTVDIHIAKLRRKIEINPKLPEHLITHRGEGYQLYVFH